MYPDTWPVYLTINRRKWTIQKLMFRHCPAAQSCWLFVSRWTAPRQVSLSFTVSQSLLKLTSTELLMPPMYYSSNYLVFLFVCFCFFFKKKKKGRHLSHTHVCVCAQSCLTLFDFLDCRPPDSPVHRPPDFPGKNAGINCHSLPQGSSWPRNQTRVSCVLLFIPG